MKTKSHLNHEHKKNPTPLTHDIINYDHNTSDEQLQSNPLTANTVDEVNFYHKEHDFETEEHEPRIKDPFQFDFTSKLVTNQFRPPTILFHKR